MPSDDPMASQLQVSQPFASAVCGDEVSDALLLERFVEQWDQAAFRELLVRHGPMVLGVCRRILRDPHAAEDAFQVTFWQLVQCAARSASGSRSAPGCTESPSASLSRRGRARRGGRCRCRSLDPEAGGVNEHDGLERDELHAALHEELGRLPEKYRAPLVLCYIEGLPHEAVARQLGWPIGTVRGELPAGVTAWGPG